MKAEHRKELQTNVLADRMGRLVQGMKTGSRPTSVGMWILTVTVVGILVAWYFARGSMSRQSAAWVRFNAAASDPNSLRNLALENPGTLPARTARFQRARLLLRDGLAGVYGQDRPSALVSLEDAAKLYGELIPECTGNALLQQEALMGAAKAEEARLIGISKKEDADKFEAQFNRALALYERLAREYPQSYLGEAAQRHAQELTENRDKVLDFYAELNRLKKPPAASVGSSTD
jgi:hypothetical protein